MKNINIYNTYKAINKNTKEVKIVVGWNFADALERVGIKGHDRDEWYCNCIWF